MGKVVGKHENGKKERNSVARVEMLLGWVKEEKNSGRVDQS